MIILAMMFPVLCFTSCGGSDNDSSDISSGGYSVDGTWMGYSCGNSDPNDLSENHTLTLIFNSNGSGNYSEKDNLFTDKCDFTYQMESSTKGKAYISTRSSNIYFVIEGNKMYVYGHGYGQDLDFLLTKQ